MFGNAALASVRNKSVLVVLAVILAAAGLLVCLMPGTAHASAGCYDLTSSRYTWQTSVSGSFTVSKYDVTGDGKADKVKFKRFWGTKSKAHILRIYVNGKRALSVKSVIENKDRPPVWSVKIAKLDNGRSYIYLTQARDNGRYIKSAFYRYYKSGRAMKMVKDISKCTWRNCPEPGGPDTRYASIKKVLGNKIYLELGWGAMKTNPTRSIVLDYS